MPSTYTLISSNVLGSSASSVTFSSIPATYTDLVLRVSARGDDGGLSYEGFWIRVNGNSSQIYSNTNLFANNTTVVANRDANVSVTNVLMSVGGSTATSNTFGNTEVYIPSYRASQNKQMSSSAVTETNASSTYIGVMANLARDTNPITSLEIRPLYSSNFVSGSSFYLYGIKNS
jgi:hypothetical protein